MGQRKSTRAPEPERQEAGRFSRVEGGTASNFVHTEKAMDRMTRCVITVSESKIWLIDRATGWDSGLWSVVEKRKREK